jgi:hypothetical protein
LYYISRRLILGVVLFVGALANGQNSSAAPDPTAHRSGQNDAPTQGIGQQPTGTISGTVLDQTGAVAVGARVRIAVKGKTSNESVNTGENGQFFFGNVPAGSFQITVTAAGFGSQLFSGDLQPGQSFLVPAMVLPLAIAQTQVQVGVDSPEVADAQIKEQEKQRVLAFIPNFYVSYVPDAAHLNTKQKFELAWKEAVDPITFVGAGLVAGAEQWNNIIPGYGQGAQGYGKRLGAQYASSVTSIFIGNAILPSLLKQDPRYFYQGTGSTRSRLWHAVSSSVITKGDNKRWQPNYSGVLGSLAAGGMSNLYYPAGDRKGAGVVFQNALINVGLGSLGGVFQEFVVPHLTPRFRHHDQAKNAPAQP